MNLAKKCTIIISGGNGWLGQFLYNDLNELKSDFPQSEISIHITYNSKVPTWIDSSLCHQLNFIEDAKVIDLIETCKPDIFIHLAAITSPVGCEKDPELTRKINCPALIIDTLQVVNPNCLFIFSSTDLVYEGNAPPYDEGSPLTPGTVYGKTKASFENHVLKLKYGVVLRLSNMIGPKFCLEKVGVKFLEWLVDMKNKREYIGLFHDQLRSFVSVMDVVRIISMAIKTFIIVDKDNSVVILNGVFNLGGPSSYSRLDLAQILCDVTSTRLIVHESKIEGYENQESDTWAVYKTSNSEVYIAPEVQNPRDVTMNVSKVENNFGIKLKCIKDAILESM